MSVLLYSGGMDSLCVAWLNRYDTLLRVSTGSQYDDAESEVVTKLAAMAPGVLSPITSVPSMFDFSSIERPDFIVPNRNAHLVLAASLYADEIHLAAVNGDRSRDKDEGFCAVMKALLDHMWGEQHWTARKVFDVRLPFAHLCKSQLLKAALIAALPLPLLWVSRSCYMSGRYECGVCKPCVRKYVALRSCGLYPPKFQFVDHPREAAWLPGVLDLISSGQRWRCAEEDNNFLTVFAS